MERPDTVYAHTEHAHYERYPSYLCVQRMPNGSYQVIVRSRDTCSAGMIELTPAQFAAFRLSLEEYRRGEVS